jgi:uncharacterized repeat protein (TIGR03843 family)
MEDEQQPAALSTARVLAALSRGTIEPAAAMPYSSNFTLLTTVEHEGLQIAAIYKPQRGERPLWDFPRGTLYRRETAAYLISEALGFGLVPPTVARSGPYGPGMLQFYIDNDEEVHLFTLLKSGGYESEIRRLCAFDCLINNADRKSGHALLGSDGRLWAIDHGICFHYEPKLRTVLWDFVGETLPDEVISAFERLELRLNDPGDELAGALRDLLAAGEVRALKRRLKALLERGAYPEPYPGIPHVPWPPV